MSRPTPINTQSSNTLDRLKKKVVNFLSPIKSGFSPTSPRKSQKPLPPFEPQTQLPSVAIRPVEPSLRPSASRSSLHPADARRSSRADSRRRSTSRDSRRSRERSPSRSFQAPRRPSASGRSTHSFDSRRSFGSRRSFDSRYTRDDSYDDVDDRDFYVKRDAGTDINDGVKHLWTNLYLEGKYIGHFYCRQEPRVSPKSFFPGMIIWAMHSVFQNNRNATPGDRRITYVKDAPVYSKSRPMVVLYQTRSGLCCAPMFSLDGNTRKSGWTNDKELEYVSLAAENDDWAGDTKWAGVLQFRPDPRRRRPLKSRCFIGLGQTMYVSTQEYLETDAGYLPGDMYNRLIIALDFYQEKRKRLAFEYFKEEYKNRGLKLAVEGDIGLKEKRKVADQNERMGEYLPTRNDDTMIWSLVERHRFRELTGHDAEMELSSTAPPPVPEFGVMSVY